MHGDEVDAVAREQVEVADRAQDVARGLADDRLHHHQVASAQGLEIVRAVARRGLQADAVGAAQRDHRVAAAVHHHAVAHFEPGVGRGVGELGVAAHQVQHLDDAVGQTRLAQRLAGEMRTFGHEQFGHEPALAGAELLAQGLAYRQQPGRKHQHEGAAHQRDQHRRQADLEHRERRQTLLARDAIDQDVGRGAHHGDQPAEDGRVGERDQQARGRQALARRDRDHCGDHHHHHRGVVDEGRHQQAGGDQRQQQPALARAGRGGEPLAELVHAAGARQRGADDEQAGDGDRRAVAEHAEHFLGAQHPRREQHAHRHHHRDVGLAPFAHEGDEQGDQHETDEERGVELGEQHGGGQRRSADGAAAYRRLYASQRSNGAELIPAGSLATRPACGLAPARVLSAARRPGVPARCARARRRARAGTRGRRWRAG